MDLRTARTEKNIINAFIQLRAKKPLEKITIKELCALAMMNKATFYRHYEDIYDLSDKLENQLIEECLSEFPDTDSFFTKDGISRLITVFTTKSQLYNTLFADNREDVFVRKLHTLLCRSIYQKHPEMQQNPEKSILLSVVIYGVFHAFLLHKNEDAAVLRDSLAKASVLLK